MITVKPFGGLANRMRALDSCYWLTKKSQEPLHLIWENNFELNCSFHKLFEVPEGVTVEERSRNRSALSISKRIDSCLRFFGFKVPRGYDFYLFNEEVVRLEEMGYDFEEILKFKSVYINTVQHFYKTEASFSYFKPVTNLQKKIDEYVDQFSKNTIGVHIRRSDNAHAIKYSPLSGFLSYMNNEIEEDPNTRFFLATDSPEVSLEIYEKFGNRVLSHEKNLDRNTEKGIMDALIDLYCLSNCKKVIGSYYSSFSEVAAQINTIELSQIYEANKND